MTARVWTAPVEAPAGGWPRRLPGLAALAEELGWSVQVTVSGKGRYVDLLIAKAGAPTRVGDEDISIGWSCLSLAPRWFLQGVRVDGRLDHGMDRRAWTLREVEEILLVEAPNRAGGAR